MGGSGTTFCPQFVRITGSNAYMAACVFRPRFRYISERSTASAVKREIASKL
jgi:hypothetical protein